MSDVLGQEFRRHDIYSGEDLYAEVYTLPRFLRKEYLERKHFVDRYNWYARGQMALVIDGEVTKELINLKESVPSTQSELRVVEKNGSKELLQTVVTEEYGEIAPHGSGMLFPSPKRQ